MTEVDPAFSGPAFSASITSRLPAAATASSHPPDMYNWKPYRTTAVSPSKSILSATHSLWHIVIEAVTSQNLDKNASYRKQILRLRLQTASFGLRNWKSITCGRKVAQRNQSAACLFVSPDDYCPCITEASLSLWGECDHCLMIAPPMCRALPVKRAENAEEDH